MLVVFTDASSPPMTTSECVAYQKVVTQALVLLRPAAETWAVTMASESAVTRLDFTRETDAPRSFTVASGDDDQHSQMFRLVCKFIWAYWPTDTAARS
jgi:hypothetical protein